MKLPVRELAEVEARHCRILERELVGLPERTLILNIARAFEALAQEGDSAFIEARRPADGAAWDRV